MARRLKQHSENGEKASTAKVVDQKSPNQNATEVREDNPTAVSWLIDQLENWWAVKIYLPSKLLESAKEMERKQIESAYARGMNFPWVMGFTDIQPDEEAKIYFEKIYGN
jgi:hypothetical protein